MLSRERCPEWGGGAPRRRRSGAAAPQCTRFIYGYMAFAGFSIFFTLTGLIALQLVARLGLALDAVSFTFVLYNFAARPAPAGVPHPHSLSLSNCS